MLWQREAEKIIITIIILSTLSVAKQAKLKESEAHSPAIGWGSPLYAPWAGLHTNRRTQSHRFYSCKTLLGHLRYTRAVRSGPDSLREHFTFSFLSVLCPDCLSFLLPHPLSRLPGTSLSCVKWVVFCFEECIKWCDRTEFRLKPCSLSSFHLTSHMLQSLWQNSYFFSSRQ